jgi:hypothetical protein
MHNNLQITYKNNKPYGIRDENGYLIFFADVPKFPDQEYRYHQEVRAQLTLASYLLSSLQAWGLTPPTLDGTTASKASGEMPADVLAGNYELEVEWQTATDGFPAGIAFKEWLANQVVALRKTAQHGVQPTPESGWNLPAESSDSNGSAPAKSG